MKLAIVATHPIQYQVPWFRTLAQQEGVGLTVYFALIPDADQQGVGFGVSFQWDIPLLDGYHWELLHNRMNNPSLDGFRSSSTPDISRVFKRNRPDAVIITGWQSLPLLQALWACRRQGIPAIIRGEANDLRPRSWWKRQLHRLLLRQYSACLYIGERNRRFYLANGVPAGLLFFTPYCVEGKRFASNADSLRHQREKLRAAWGIPSSAIVFLFCAKFIAKKRPMDCLKALEKIVKCETGKVKSELQPENSVHLLMVGSGELMEECREYAVQHNLPVTFAGFLNQGEIAKAYAVADCLVLPSDDGETWGLVVNEAMACGLPALVSDRVGCHADLVIPGVTGHVFPFGDTDSLGLMMAELSSQRQNLKGMGAVARERVAAYNYDEVVRGTLAAVDFVTVGTGKF